MRIAPKLCGPHLIRGTSLLLVPTIVFFPPKFHSIVPFRPVVDMFAPLSLSFSLIKLLELCSKRQNQPLKRDRIVCYRLTMLS